MIKAFAFIFSIKNIEVRIDVLLYGVTLSMYFCYKLFTALDI